MRIRKRLVILLLLIAGFIGYKYYKRHKTKGSDVSEEMMFLFKDKQGPLTKSILPLKQKTSWRNYATGPSYGVAVLLSDTNSAWLGIVHAFKSFGIPFRLYSNTDSAIKHDMVMVYPMLTGKLFKEQELIRMDDYLRNGGTLLAVNVLGGITEDFGFAEAIPSRKNFKVKINDKNNARLSEFTDAKETEISLGDRNNFKETIGTYSYSKPLSTPLLVYENNEACLTQYHFKSGGSAFALGIDIGEFVLRSENERGFNAQRTYVNDYEPSLDVLIRVIKNIYTSSSSSAVTLNTVPLNKAITVCLTHDIDFTRSIKNAVDYAKMENQKGVKATYFIQTKYIKDWNDDIFFNDTGVGYLNTVSSLGMEIASHSVSHSHAYSKFEEGTGGEQYPAYRPFVKGRDEATGGSVVGELRVSKFLLDNCVSNTNVLSFRPGHLSYPFSLPQYIVASGYKYSSSITANNALTHLPYQMQYNRETEQELNAFEFPVTIEDEEKPRMDLRLDKSLALAKKLSAYGGLLNVLIHTDTLAYKYNYETALIDSLKNTAVFYTIKEFGNWWLARNGVTFSVEKQKQLNSLHVNTTMPIKEIGFTLPAGWVCKGNDANIVQTGNEILIHQLNKELTIEFSTVNAH